MSTKSRTTSQRKDTSSSIRIRDNQRRSRTRRAELLQSLQARVHEYERQGVAATVEVQQAARKVAQDNVRLRALLALCGVSSEQVDSFLQSPDAALHLPSLPRPTTSILQTDPPPPRTVPDGDDMHDTHNHYGSYNNNDNNYCGPAMETLDCPPSIDCFCAPPPPTDQLPTSSGLEISCEAAATIIAEMRGDEDRDAIRASLGCRGQDHCTIKNSTVLQLLEKE